MLVEFVCIIHLTAIAHVIDPMFDLCPDIKKREREAVFGSVQTQHCGIFFCCLIMIEFSPHLLLLLFWSLPFP